MRRALLLVAALSLVCVACGGGSKKAASSGDSLVGLFRITAATCDSDTPAGSWFRMVQPGGNAASGPYVSNPDSTCADTTVTPLAPGDDGGLKTGTFQAAMIRPQGFFAVPFDVSTNEQDPQSGTTVKAPTITRSGSTLQGDLSAISVAWNQQHFNQGAPKPDGSTPGLTRPVQGRYNRRTKAFEIIWYSSIVGGPFNGFTGYWHLQGHVR